MLYFTSLLLQDVHAKDNICFYFEYNSHIFISDEYYMVLLL